MRSLLLKEIFFMKIDFDPYVDSYSGIHVNTFSFLMLAFGHDIFCR